MVDITDKYLAYCFDEAIAYVGNFVRSKLDECEGNNKREIEGKQRLVLEKLFGTFKPDDNEELTSPTAYRDPMDLFNKRK